MVNSLAQLTLKIMSPGVPDFYQGCELWDLSLVDPDNRREVDFKRRQAILDDADAAPSWAVLLRSWRTGEIKLWVTRVLLNFRSKHRALFQHGEYRAVEVTGRFSANVVAFSRTYENESVIVLVPRLTSRLGSPPLGLVWDDTAVALPATQEWKDVATGRAVKNPGAALLADLFAELPFAVLARDDE
jgi:(1->4)-alpha-D-glucan 1-alpha-D-glucosylmutase